MEFESVFSYEGPLATVQVQALEEQEFDRPQAVQPGIYADRIWRASPQSFDGQPGLTYRVTVEAQVEGS
jgi:hypothetical protein